MRVASGQIRIGVDLGGTKIEVAALDRKQQFLFRERVPTPRHDYEAALCAIADLVRRCEQDLGVFGSVGVAIPGTESPLTRTIKNANSTWLNGRLFSADLGAALGRSIRVANDANCFVLSECVGGVAPGVASGAGLVFGVILGTGVGAGMVVRGQLWSGANGLAGEWGHNPLPWPTEDEYPGPTCWCGQRGCQEAWLSGPGVSDDHWRQTGQRLDATAIFSKAESEPACFATRARWQHRLARALAHVINFLDPDVIVLGGGLGQASGVTEAVCAQWGAWIFSGSEPVRTRILLPRFGDSSGVRGAAWLWD